MTESAPHWPRFNRLQQRRDWMLRILTRLDDETLAKLLRVAGESPKPLEEGAGPAVSDGFPASSLGGGDTRSVGDDGGVVARPTEHSALRYYRVDGSGRFVAWVDEIDNVGQALEEAFAMLAEAEGVLNKVDRRRDYVMNNGQTMVGRVSSLQGDCECCGRGVAGTSKDRLRSGFCMACYMAWLRVGRPERPPWIAQRRKAWEDEGDPRPEPKLINRRKRWAASLPRSDSEGYEQVRGHP